MPQQALPVDANLSVRLAERDDAESLALFARQAFRDAYRLIDDPADIEDYVTRHFTSDTFACIVEDARSTVLVAEVNHELTGYAHVMRSVPPPCVNGPKPIELARLYLWHESIGIGYGATLLRAVLTEARRQQCETIWLAVYDRNERARAFYKRWGFADVGTKDFLFGGRTYADPVMSAPVRDDALQKDTLEER
jgi:GNAT superfamily N-acetyltransferase